MVELHGEERTSVGGGTQLGRVSEHLGHGNDGRDDLQLRAGLQVLDPAAPGVQISDHVTHPVLGHRDLDLHQGLEQRDAGQTAGIAVAHGTGDLERHLRGIDLVERTVEQFDEDVTHGVAREHNWGILYQKFCNSVDCRCANAFN